MEQLKEGLADLREQNRQLLNRLQAEDVQTFKQLQFSSNVGVIPVDDFQYPRSDEGIIMQMQHMYGDKFDPETYVDDGDMERYNKAASAFGWNE